MKRKKKKQRPIPPNEPTSEPERTYYRPGSQGKLDVMRERIEKGERLYNTADGYDEEDD